MKQSPKANTTLARHHFAHCEYRQLFKRFEPKYEDLWIPASESVRYVIG